MPFISEILTASGATKAMTRPLTEADVEIECSTHKTAWRASERPPITAEGVSTYYCPDGCEVVVVRPQGDGWAMDNKGGGVMIHVGK